MAWFVEYEPENKKDYNQFYNKYDLFLRRAVFEDYIDAAEITSVRQGENADHNENLKYFKKKFENRSDKDEYFTAYIVNKNDPDAAEKIIGYSHVAYCDFTLEEYKEYKKHNTPSGWYLLGLGVYPEYRRLGIGTKLTEIRQQWAKEHSYEKKVYFYTNTRNITSQEFHKKMGYKVISGEWFFMDRESYKTVLFEIDI